MAEVALGAKDRDLHHLVSFAVVALDPYLLQCLRLELAFFGVGLLEGLLMFYRWLFAFGTLPHVVYQRSEAMPVYLVPAA